MLHTQTSGQMEHQGTVGREGTGTGGPIKQHSKLQPKPVSKSTRPMHAMKIEDAVTLNSSIGAGPSAVLAAERTGAGPLCDPLALLDPLWLRLPQSALPLPEEPCLLLEGTG